MNLDLVVEQLRANAPILGGRVAGAAEFTRGLESTVWMERPAAYVVPLEDAAEGNDQENGLRQLVTERIGVIVNFDNTGDRRGQSVTSQYEPMRAALFAAVLNWNLDPLRAARGLVYGGGRLLDLDRARLFYQWEFGLEITITDADGWQLPREPLLAIEANSNPGDPWVPARVDLPQI